MSIDNQVNVGHYQLVAAARLLNDLDGQRRREARSYIDGYHDGHRAGCDLGYDQAEQDMAKAWRAVAGVVRPHGNGLVGHSPPPGLAELQRIRDQPGGAFYLDRLARHRRRQYEGGPVDWETGQPLRPPRKSNP